jgi:uncharacterized protein
VSKSPGCPFILLIIILMVSACATTSNQSVSHDASVPLNHLPALSGDYFEWASESVGRSFHIYVRLPLSYGEGEGPYPVVYLLDGDSLFPILAANQLFLEYDDGLPEMIVVGIAYGSFDSPVNRRGYDFSAPAADADEDQGGAPAFHAFLKDELIPAVQARYDADPDRTILFGQSRGGYMVLYSAFTEPDLFWGRIASNPVFHPGRERFFSTPSKAVRDDLGLVVTSGSQDFPRFREAALEWFDVWKDSDTVPWALEAVSIEGGTHAADSARSYRAGINWLFKRQ